MIKSIFNKIGLLAPSYEMVMTNDEKVLFKDIVVKSKSYLEFGIGGSTLFVLENSKAKVYSVESDKSWVEKIKKYPYVKRNEVLKRLEILFVDIGPTRKWGYPKGNNYKNKYPNYSNQIFESKMIESVDTVFVDGRFRVACILNSILFYYKNPNIKILIHDFTNRPHYHLVLKYLDILTKVDTLVVCEIKTGFNYDGLKREYEEYKYNAK